ncbi:MAG: CARDB domain-containing protein [Patescibacteria group bacterium]
MEFEAFLDIVDSPRTATTIAAFAFLTSLYVLYAQNRLRRGRRKAHADFFHLPRITLNGTFPIFKDLLALGAVAILAGVFFWGTHSSFIAHAKENISMGVRFLKVELTADWRAGLGDTVVVPAADMTATQDAAVVEGVVALEEGNASDTSSSESVAEGKDTEAEPPPPPPKKSAPVVEVKKEVLVMPPDPAPIVVPPPPVPESAGPAPDVTAVTLSHYGAALIPGTPLSFSVIIKNIGDADAVDSFNTRLSIDEGNDGSRNVTLAELETLSLKKGDQETKIWRGAWFQKPGTHRAEVCTDTANALFELDEKNNCVSLVFTVQGAETSGDLIASNAAMLPAAPAEGNPVSFFVDVKNIGVSRTSGSYTRLKIDDTLLGNYRISSLSVGVSEKVEWKTIWKATVGDHRYEICADGNNEVFETDESNNCTVGTFSVPEN